MEITVKEMVKLLESNGFQKIRSKGSHFRYSDGNGHKVTIPAGHGMKEVLKPGTVNSIKKQAGAQIGPHPISLSTIEEEDMT